MRARHRRCLLNLGLATTVAGCAAAPPCTPTKATPQFAKPDSKGCSGDGGFVQGTPSVVRYGYSDTGSITPDRIIAGPHTDLCGPGSIVQGPRGELYVLNSAASNGYRRHAWVTVFDSSANGDATPIRTLDIRPSALGSPYSLGVDRGGYLYAGSAVEPLIDSGSVLVFPAGADGNAEPTRVIAGPATGLRRPVVLALNRRDHLYVTNEKEHNDDDTVRVFAPGAGGDVAPCRVIAGPRTGFEHPLGIALDRSDRLYVPNAGHSSWSRSNSVTVYDAWANGDVAPIRRVAGKQNYDRRMEWPVRVVLDSHDSLYVRTIRALAVFAPGADGTPEPARYITGPLPYYFTIDRHDTLYAVLGDTVLVFAPPYTGDTPAVRRLTGSRSGVHGIAGIAVDGHGWLYLAVRDSSLIRVYAPGADGDVAPKRTIIGTRTQLRYPGGLAVDAGGRLYVANGPQPGGGGAIRVYAPGAAGEDQPVRILTGRETGLTQPTDIEFDSRGNMYVPGSGYDTAGVVAVFRPQAYGNEAPIRAIMGPATLLRRPTALAFGRGDTLYALNVFGYGDRCHPLGLMNTTVTTYSPGAEGDAEPVRELTLMRDGKSPGSPYGLRLLRGLAVDSAGAVRVWHPGGSVTYPPGAHGLVEPIRTTATPSDGADASGVSSNGSVWVYEGTVPSIHVCT
jgi:sugar lactone lactonase YvrE